MKKVLLCIMDGIGLSDNKEGNAFYNAKTPNYDYLINTYPYSKLIASGEEVGLPAGQMGNSEVGHTNIGAGRIVYQSLEYINNKIKTKEFFQNKELLDVINYVKENIIDIVRSICRIVLWLSMFYSSFRRICFFNGSCECDGRN